MPVTINGTTGIAGVDGSAGTPAVQGADANTGVFFPAADTIAFAEGGAEVARFDSSGNLGVGSSSITRAFTNYNQLNLNGSSGANIQMQYGGSLASNITADSNALYLQNITSIVFGTGGTGTGTERARIDSSGNLLVGTTNNNPVAGRVNGLAIASSGFTTIRAANNMALGLSGSSGGHIAFYTDNGSTFVTAGNISSNGSTTSYNGTSDYRLKDNIRPLNNALARVAQLRPVLWTWKEGFGGTQPECEGFIAHELQEVVPVAVTGEKDAVDAEGNPVYQGIDTSFLSATLAAAIQELHQIVQAQAAEIAELKANLP